jgi:cytochrome c553
MPRPERARARQLPKLAGAEEDYLVDRLETYRAGEKVGPNSALMIPHAAELSDEDIANIAGYIVATFP